MRDRKGCGTAKDADGNMVVVARGDCPNAEVLRMVATIVKDGNVRDVRVCVCVCARGKWCWLCWLFDCYLHVLQCCRKSILHNIFKGRETWRAVTCHNWA